MGQIKHAIFYVVINIQYFSFQCICMEMQQLLVSVMTQHHQHVMGSRPQQQGPHPLQLVMGQRPQQQGPHPLQLAM